MITKSEIENQLKKFNSYGKPVIVHTSLKAIGEIEGGADTLLDALVSVFASNGGVLCIPTHTWKKCVLDLNKAESCLGVLPTIASARKNGVRSMHPTHSITVFGEKAEEFVKNEAFVDSPTNPNGCYGNILQEKGYVLLIGVGQEKNTLIHCIEELLEIPNRLTKETITAQIIDKNGIVTDRKLRWFDPIIPDVSVNFGKFEKAFRYYGAIEDGKLGNAKMQFCSSEKMMEALRIIYSNTKGKEILGDDAPLDEMLYIMEEKI